MALPVFAKCSAIDAENLSSALLPDEASSGRRAGRWQITFAFMGISSALVNLIIPVHLAVLYGSANALTGTAMAVVYSSIIAGGMAYFAVKTQQKSSELSEKLFGRSGSAFPTAVLCLTGLWYAVFEGSIVAVTAAKVFPVLSYEAAAVLVALCTAPLGIGGVQSILDRLNGCLLPFYIAGLVALVIATGTSVGYTDEWLHLGPIELPDGALWHCFAAFGGTAVLGLVAMDFAHVGRRHDALYLATVPFGVPMFVLTQLVNALVGVFVVGSQGMHVAKTETGLIDTTISILGPFAALAYVVISQTRINSANVYVAVLNLHSLTLLAKRRGCCRCRGRVPPSDDILKLAAGCVVGAVILAVMLFSDVFATLETVLLVQGVLMTAWVGVAAVHVVRWLWRGQPCHDAGPEGVPEWRWAGFSAWAVGVVVGLALLFGNDGHASSFAATLTPFLSLVLSLGAAAVLGYFEQLGWIQGLQAAALTPSRRDLDSAEALPEQLSAAIPVSCDKIASVQDAAAGSIAT